MELMKEKWSAGVSVISIGATKEEGGTRSKTVKIGGEKTLPFLFAEAELPNKPVVAFEIFDTPPQDWRGEKDPLLWAEKAVKEHGAEILCLRLLGAHPDSGNISAEDEAKFVAGLLKKVSVPLVIIGCGDDAKDNSVLHACSEAARGERCLIGDVVQDNYKTIVAACIADGHNVIAESPIDINIAKQLNILISDMGLPLERIVINPTIGALGYGLEYAYSIMERARLAALAGDKTLANPFICFVGQEVSRSKEAREASMEFAIIWEAITATALIQAGADLLVMRSPEAIKKVSVYIDTLYKG